MDYNFNINIDLNNYKDFQKASTIFRDVGYIIERAVDEFCVALRAKLIENMIASGLGGSKLMNDISIRKLKNGISFTVGEYACFLEFGTGVKGSHPKAAEEGWVYNRGLTKGWYYPTISSDPNPTKKYTKSGQLVAWTGGHEARKFLYKTWLWGTRAIGYYIHSNIAKELRKYGY